MAIAALMGVGTAVKGEEVPSLDLNFDGQTSSYTRATTSPTAAKANGDQLATSIVSCARSTTATFMGSNGLIQTAAVNTPRVEYDTSGNPLGLLVEEARTNYVLDSMDVSAGATNWSAYAGVTDVSGVTLTGPDGGTVQVVAADASNSYSALNQTVSVTADCVACSIYVSWPGTSPSDNIVIRAEGTNHAADSGFTSWTETVTQYRLDRSNTTSFYRQGRGYGENPTVEDVGNGWYRVSFVARTNGGTVDRLFVYPFFNGTSDRAAFWGAQVEVGQAPTSVIETASATVTRDDDDITLATSAFGYDNASGTTVVDVSVASETEGNDYARVFEYQGATQDDRIFLRSGEFSDKLDFAYKNGGTQVTTDAVSGPITPPYSYKVGIAHSGTSVNAAVDGVLRTEKTIPEMTNPHTTLRLGGQVSNTSNVINGHIRRLTYWPRAINDAQLSKFTNQ